MPVRDQANGGPLNYEQINDLINFLRAPSTQEYDVRDPSTKEPVTDANGKEETFTGWRDPNFKPAPGATPFPDCWSDAFNNPSPSASGSAAPSGSATTAPSGGGTAITVKALNIAFDPTELTAPAGQAFTLNFDNEDAGIPHNIQIMDPSGGSAFKGEIFSGVGTKAYNVPALTAGAYKFVCDVHPNMTGTLTVK
jgi:plastocyanin